MRLGHEGRAAFLATGDETDAILAGMQAVEHGKIAFAGNAECMGDALGQKAVDKKVAGKLLGHALYCALAAPALNGSRRLEARRRPAYSGVVGSASAPPLSSA